MRGNFLFIHVNEWATPESPDAIPISSAYALASLRRLGFSGAILGDYKGAPLQPGRLRAALTELRPLALGFSVYEENINRVRVWARFAKQVAPEVLIALGGPQVTFMPAGALREMSEVDILCRGEGEAVMTALAEALSRREGLSGVPGICYEEQGRLVETAPCQATPDLDSLPSPYLDDTIDVSGKERVIILSSRGCTSPCTFCYTTRASNKIVRFHSVERVIAELRHLKAKGISDFWFADPNFAYSRKRLMALLEAIIASVGGITFWCQTRYNLIDQEILALLKEAGAHTIAFGLESADREVLKTINKGLDPARMGEVIRMVQEAGIAVELFTLFGLPSETFSQACSTLDYVRAHQVAVDGNSISQQLHLFFGTPISCDPAGHGIRPLPQTKPGYLSICRDFETESMTAREIRRMSMLWRLNRQDFADDLAAGANLFEIAGFITGNYEDLRVRPEADLMLARIYMHLEEYPRAAARLQRLQADFAGHSRVREFLAGPFPGFKANRRAAAAPGCRIIYDCRGTLDGKVVPATVGYYQEAVLGDGRLLPDFEAGVQGLRAGRWSQCEVRFPASYGHAGLAGKTVVFQIFLHLVLEPVVVTAWEDIAGLPRNVYRFHDLPALRDHNQKLYFLVLRDTAVRGLTQDMTDFFFFLGLYLKLGFREEAEAMLVVLPQDETMRTYAGRIFLANGLAERTLEILGPAADPENAANRIKALIKLERYREADTLAADPAYDGDVAILDLRVGLASLLRLPTAVYHQRMDALLDHQVRSMAAEASRAARCPQGLEIVAIDRGIR